MTSQEVLPFHGLCFQCLCCGSPLYSRLHTVNKRKQNSRQFTAEDHLEEPRGLLGLWLLCPSSFQVFWALLTWLAWQGPLRTVQKLLKTKAACTPDFWFFRKPRKWGEFPMSPGRWFGEGLHTFKLMVWYLQQLRVHLIWGNLEFVPWCRSTLFDVLFYVHSFIYAPLCSRTYLSLTAFQHLFLICLQPPLPRAKAGRQDSIFGLSLLGDHSSEVKRPSNFGPASWLHTLLPNAHSCLPGAVCIIVEGTLL